MPVTLLGVDKLTTPESLEREAAQCLCLYPWPALAQSLLDDARALRVQLWGQR
jgi:hypothetical protein